MSERVTRAWSLYESGVSYNNRLTPNQYQTVETNTEFFAGNQWIHLPDTPAMRRLPKPTFNILERVASLFIASLTSSAVTIRVEPLANSVAGPVRDLLERGPEADEDAARYVNAALGNLLEKLKFDYRVRDALYDGAVTGDYCAHFWFDPDAKPYGTDLDADGLYRGDIRMELVDGINVMFGNPNDQAAERQPYILIVGRDTVKNLKEEARRHGQGAEAESVQEDAETRNFTGVGGKTELEADADAENGKALYVILYEKKDGKVRVTKATRNAVIYEDVDTGLSVYPVAWGNWRKRKNQYHGQALISSLINNQIEINRMFAVTLRHLQTTAYPKILYDADILPYWSDAVGEPVAVRGLQQSNLRISDVATSFHAPEMSAQISGFIDKVLAYTKECMGATDAQMGNARPDNMSALMVLQTNAEVPLENIRAGLYEWAEDCGRILLDMMGAYYGLRPVVVERERQEFLMGPDGLPQIAGRQFAARTLREKVVDFFDFSQCGKMWSALRVDVGATTYFSEIAMTQTLDNLRRDGILTAEQYLERVPDKLIPRKEELLRNLENGAGPASQGGGPPTVGGPLSAEKMERGLPASMQSTLSQVPAKAQRVLRMMGNLRAAR